jgi:hypothetical protein
MIRAELFRQDVSVCAVGCSSVGAGLAVAL